MLAGVEQTRGGSRSQQARLLLLSVVSLTTRME